MFSDPPHFTPPTTLEDGLSRLRLARSQRIGPVSYHRLIAEHGSAEEALRALPQRAQTSGLQGYTPCTEAAARAEIAAGHRAGARLLFHGLQGYPQALLDTPDAPPVLWALGDPSLIGRPTLALVGARNASSLGLRMARRLALDLGGAGFVIASGLARGIDAAVHEAALPTGTIAVQAGGIDVIYPLENTDLAQRIAGDGLRLSELPPGFAPRAQHFPQRNRIIAGLATAVVVVEATLRSGSIGTAQIALERGREVMAVPGHPLDARAAGCNALLRDGATLIRDAADVIAAVPGHFSEPSPETPPAEAARAAPAETTSGEAGLDHRILTALGTAPLAEAALLDATGCPPESLYRALLPLELGGRIARLPGGLIALT